MPPNPSANAFSALDSLLYKAQVTVNIGHSYKQLCPPVEAVAFGPRISCHVSPYTHRLWSHLSGSVSTLSGSQPVIRARKAGGLPSQTIGRADPSTERTHLLARRRRRRSQVSLTMAQACRQDASDPALLSIRPWFPPNLPALLPDLLYHLFRLSPQCLVIRP